MSKALVRLVCLMAIVGLSLRAGAEDDCNAVMAALTAAQNDAHDQMDAVNGLEAAMNAPGWDPVSEGWMVGAYANAVEDLIGALNTEAIAEERAHEAHCY